MQYHILVVTSELKSTPEYIELFESSGFKVSRLANGENVAKWVKHHNPDIVLLEILPVTSSYSTVDDCEIDTIHYCNEIRRFSSIPLVVVTASEQQQARMESLDVAVSAYLNLPYQPEELVIKCFASIAESEKRVVQSSRLTLEHKSLQLHLGDNSVQLTGLEFDLLRLLLEQPNRTFTRTEILDAIYQGLSSSSERAIDNQIKNLRHKLKHLDAEQQMIQSVYGVGYKFNAELA